MKRQTFSEGDYFADREDASYSEIKLAMKRGVPQHMWQLWKGGKTVNAKPEELSGIEEYIIYAPQQGVQKYELK